MWAARYGRRAARPNGEAKPRCSPTVRHDAPRRDFKSDGSTGTRPRKRRRGAASDQSPSKRTGIRSPVRRRWLPRARRQGDRGDASGRGQLGLLRGTRSSSDSLVHDWLRRSRHDADLDDGPSHRGSASRIGRPAPPGGTHRRRADAASGANVVGRPHATAVVRAGQARVDTSRGAWPQANGLSRSPVRATTRLVPR